MATFACNETAKFVAAGLAGGTAAAVSGPAAVLTVPLAGAVARTTHGALCSEKISMWTPLIGAAESFSVVKIAQAGIWLWGVRAAWTEAAVLLPTVRKLADLNTTDQAREARGVAARALWRSSFSKGGNFAKFLLQESQKLREILTSRAEIPNELLHIDRVNIRLAISDNRLYRVGISLANKISAKNRNPFDVIRKDFERAAFRIQEIKMGLSSLSAEAKEAAQVEITQLTSRQHTLRVLGSLLNASISKTPRK